MKVKIKLPKKTGKRSREQGVAMTYDKVFKSSAMSGVAQQVHKEQAAFEAAMDGYRSKPSSSSSAEKIEGRTPISTPGVKKSA